MDDNPFQSPQTVVTSELPPPEPLNLESPIICTAAVVAIFLNSCAILFICVIGVLGIAADISASGQITAGALAVCFAAVFVGNLVGVCNRRRLGETLWGVLVLVNLILAAVPLPSIVTHARGAWYEAAGIWSLAAATLVTLLFAPQPKSLPHVQ